MKNIKGIITYIIVLSVHLINAQDRDLKRANLYFERTFYSYAIPLYEKNTKTPLSFETGSRLADAYYYTQDMDNALKWYQLLIGNFEPNLQEGHYYRYAQTLKAQEKYDEGTAILRKQIAKENDSQALNQFDREVQVLENIIAIGNRFELKNLEINTDHSDFGAVKKGKNLIFTASKKSNHWFRKIYKWNNETYLDLYSVPIDKLESGEEHVESFSKEISTKRHESNAVFTKDGMTVYFTRNNPKHIKNEETKMRISHLQIYKAKLINGKWGNIVLLPFNLEGYSTEHPALSNDGKTLYFSSDRPGTLGSFDLFSVDIHRDGTFGEPKNLGDKINTKGNEQFPFVSKDHKLYFSSNGHLGLGGLDVFVSDIQNGSFSSPLNVGLPINSGYDDFAFTIDADTKTGYFASNRPGGKGSDDIYALQEIKLLLPEDCRQFIVGTVTDKDTALFLENTLIVLQDDQKNEAGRTYTDHEGKFSMSVACTKKYTVLASKEDYTNDSKDVQTDKERKKINSISLVLKSYAQIEKEKQLEAELAEKKRQEHELLLLQQQEEAAKKKIEAELLLKKEQELAAKKQKEEALLLKQQQQEAAKRKIEAEILLKKEQKLAAKKQKEEALLLKQQQEEVAKKEKEEAEKKKKEQLEQLVNKDKNIIKERGQFLIKTEPIYFDYNLSYIRKDSKVVLDKVVEILKKYPDMVIEVGSHTDTRGTNKYNTNLSERRAAETRAYLLSKGIEPKRILAKGYGKTKPIVRCEPLESCTEGQHELNRRSEFAIKNL